MVNCSISYIIASSLSASPLFAIAPSLEASKVKMADSIVDHSLGHLFYSTSNKGATSFSLKASRISNFLSTPVFYVGISLLNLVSSSTLSYVSQTNISISRCCFSNCISTSNGGAIYVVSLTGLMTISHSYFLSNTGLTRGGAIEFNLVATQLSYTTFEANTLSDAACYGAAIHLTSDLSHPMIFSYLTLYHNPSVSQTKTFYHVIDAASGIVNTSNSNFSTNLMPDHSGLQHLSSNQSIDSYLTFANNGGPVLYFMQIYGTGNYSCCNIINNTYGSLVVYVSDNSVLTLNNYIFSENTGVLFYVSSSSLTIANCVFRETSISTSGTVSYNSCQFGVTTQTYPINVFSQMFSFGCIQTQKFSEKQAGNMDAFILKYSLLISCMITSCT